MNVKHYSNEEHTLCNWQFPTSEPVNPFGILAVSCSAVPLQNVEKPCIEGIRMSPATVTV